MNKRQLNFLALCLSAVLLLTGCAGPEFTSQQNESIKLVKDLWNRFDVPGFAVGKFVEGSWGFDSGGDPNSYFAAEIDKSLSIHEACQKANDYAKSISTSELTFFPRSGVDEDHAVVGCIADSLEQYSQGFKWNGKLESGADFKVVLYTGENLELQVSTNFEGSNGSEEEMGMGLKPEHPTVTAYLDGFQAYRTAHGIDLYTSASLAAAQLVSNTEEVKITPIVDSDGYIRKLEVKYLNDYSSNICASAMPWSEKIWGVKDPGPSYPTYHVGKLENLNNFGSYIIADSCKG